MVKGRKKSSPEVRKITGIRQTPDGSGKCGLCPCGEGLMLCSPALPCRQELCSFWILLFLRSYVVQAFKYFLYLHKWFIYVLKLHCFPKGKKKSTCLPKTVAMKRFCKTKVERGGGMFLLQLYQPVLSMALSKLPPQTGALPWSLAFGSFKVCFSDLVQCKLMTRRKIPCIFYLLIKIIGVPQSNSKIR